MSSVQTSLPYHEALFSYLAPEFQTSYFKAARSPSDVYEVETKDINDILNVAFYCVCNLNCETLNKYREWLNGIEIIETALTEYVAMLKQYAINIDRVCKEIREDPSKRDCICIQENTMLQALAVASQSAKNNLMYWESRLIWIEVVADIMSEIKDLNEVQSQRVVQTFLKIYAKVTRPTEKDQRKIEITLQKINAGFEMIMLEYDVMMRLCNSFTEGTSLQCTSERMRAFLGVTNSQNRSYIMCNKKETKRRARLRKQKSKHLLALGETFSAICSEVPKIMLKSKEYKEAFRRPLKYPRLPSCIVNPEKKPSDGFFDTNLLKNLEYIDIKKICVKAKKGGHQTPKCNSKRIMLESWLRETPAANALELAPSLQHVLHAINIVSELTEENAKKISFFLDIKWVIKTVFKLQGDDNFRKSRYIQILHSKVLISATSFFHLLSTIWVDPPEFPYRYVTYVGILTLRQFQELLTQLDQLFADQILTEVEHSLFKRFCLDSWKILEGEIQLFDIDRQGSLRGWVAEYHAKITNIASTTLSRLSTTPRLKIKRVQDMRFQYDQFTKRWKGILVKGNPKGKVSLANQNISSL